MYNFFLSYALTLVLFVALILYLIAYHPQNNDGLLIYPECLVFTQSFKALTPGEWKKWTEDDQMRAYIYGLGLRDKGMKEQNENLISAFATPYFNPTAGFYPYSIYSFGYVGPNASASFESANESIGSGS